MNKPRKRRCKWCGNVLRKGDSCYEANGYPCDPQIEETDDWESHEDLPDYLANSSGFSDDWEMEDDL